MWSDKITASPCDHSTNSNEWDSRLLVFKRVGKDSSINMYGRCLISSTVNCCCCWFCFCFVICPHSKASNVCVHRSDIHCSTSLLGASLHTYTIYWTRTMITKRSQRATQFESSQSKLCSQIERNRMQKKMIVWIFCSCLFICDRKKKLMTFKHLTPKLLTLPMETSQR